MKEIFDGETLGILFGWYILLPLLFLFFTLFVILLMPFFTLFFLLSFIFTAVFGISRPVLLRSKYKERPVVSYGRFRSI